VGTPGPGGQRREAEEAARARADGSGGPRGAGDQGAAGATGGSIFGVVEVRVRPERERARREREMERNPGKRSFFFCARAAGIGRTAIHGVGACPVEISFFL
jgi:hypothetical protein